MGVVNPLIVDVVIVGDSTGMSRCLTTGGRDPGNPDDNTPTVVEGDFVKETGMVVNEDLGEVLDGRVGVTILAREGTYVFIGATTVVAVANCPFMPDMPGTGGEGITLAFPIITGDLLETTKVESVGKELTTATSLGTTTGCMFTLTDLTVAPVTDMPEVGLRAKLLWDTALTQMLGKRALVIVELVMTVLVVMLVMGSLGSMATEG